MIWTTGADGQSPVTVTVATRSDLLADLRSRFETESGFSVATLNLDHVVKLRSDPDFHAAYARQTHVTADGRPIVWLSRLAGQTDVSLVPGSEMIDPVAKLAADCGVPTALFGATEDSLKRAADTLEARYPGLKIVSKQAPPMGFDPDGPTADAAIEALRASGARLVFLALGAPKQERFAARALDRLPHTGFLSIGAGLDFISGAQHRAPAWVRAIAMEWLWRMLSNPTRLARRYGACLVALPGLTVRALTTRLRNAS